MYRLIAWLVLGATVGLCIVPDGAGAQTEVEGAVASPEVEQPESETVVAYATDAQRDYLGRWLEYAADLEKSQRRGSGVNNIFVGTVLLGIGTGLYVSSSSSLSDFDRTLGLVLIGGSSAFLAAGIFQLARKSQGEARLERWRKANQGEMTTLELGRFEGELRAQSEAAVRALRRQRWGSFGVFMGGALILGLTPVSNLEDKRGGYALGGATAGAGLLGFALSFIGTPQADYWSAYQAGQPPGRGRRWRAAPAVGRTYVGGRLSLTF